ncbi:MAG TPA: amino acid adenylation domain-containing protein, partial [Pilimelia sp.]|nr:amino acid adenylation domain-containing protein [Pilimelia sp.]
HLSIDFLIADFISIQVLLDEMHRLYHDPATPLPPLEITFRDYLRAERGAREDGRRERDRAYWMERLDDLPPAPRLPVRDRGVPIAPPEARAALIAPPEARAALSPARFARWQTTLEPAVWERLRHRAGQHGVTPSGAVLAAYAEVVAAWSASPAFTMDVTLLNRLPLHPQVGALVGDFTGVELLAVDAGSGEPFAERARRTQAQLWQDLDHRSFTGVEVIREISRRQGPEAALFPVVFTSAIGLIGPQAGTEAEAVAGPAWGELGYGISQTPQVWIDCQNIERDGALATNWDVREGVFPDGVVADMFAAYETLLHRLADDEGAWAQVAPVSLPEAQRKRRERVNDTAAPLPEGLLHEGIVAQATRTPDRIAVIAAGRAMTYGELLGRAGTVADRLTGAARPGAGATGAGGGVRPGELVGIAMERGWEQVVAVLGILLAGGAYLPLDPYQPRARRDQILADAGVRRVLTQARLVDGTPWPDGVEVTAVDTVPPAPYRGRQPVTAPDDLAYTIYTSGSTGTPKGVMISHHSALNTVADISSRFGIGADDRVLGLSSLSFDLSVYDIFGPLAVGGCLVLPAPDRRGDPSHWGDLVGEHGVTVWNSVPAQLQMLSDYLAAAPMVNLPTLRLAMLSGDWIPVGLPDEIRRRLPGLRLISLGGATEAAIWSIYYPIGEVPPQWRSIPYGRPLANQTFHVLDKAMRPRPDWVPGDLYIGGAGLALGYLGDERKTAERFVRHPHTGERLYRTGDLGRYLPDGDIEFLGRDDAQVKIRGYRIELAEVEAALAAHPAVAAAVVVVDGDAPLDRRLVAFAEPRVRDDAAAPGMAGVVAGQLATAAYDAGDAAIAGVDRERYLDFARRLDGVALPAMVSAFQRAGLFADAGAGHTEPEIQAAAAVAPRHRRLVRRWLRALVAEGWLVTSGDRYRLGRPVVPEVVEDGWAAVAGVAEGGDARLLDYFRASIDLLPALLRGEEDPLALLFPDGKLDVSQRLYEDAVFNRWANRAAAAVVRRIADLRVDGGPLRVLEVGAGGGGTTTAVLAALAGVPVDYHCTDLSPSFLSQVRDRLGERDDLRFGVYDIDRDYREQGLAPNSYDLVVAGDVLHASTDVERALSRIRELLAPQGWLVSLEMTRDHYQIMTSLELLVRLDEAAADFTDLRRGGDQVFLDRDAWSGLLAAAGADATICLPEPGDRAASRSFIAELGMCVVAGRFKSQRSRLGAADLTAHAAQRLPEYMVPAVVQVVDKLPLTPNGKVDRKALAGWAPRRGRDRTATVDLAPLDALEQAVAGIWAQALHVPAVGRDDNLFDVGGDSLVAAQIVGRVLEEVPQAAGLFFDEVLRQLLEQPTTGRFAAYLRGAGAPAVDTGPTTADTGPTVGPVSEPGLVAVRDGDGVVNVLVHDARGSLSAYDGLVGALAGPVVGIPAAGIGDDVDLRHLAAAYARRVTAAGHDKPHIIGYGVAATLAMEVARVVAESGTPVAGLTVVAPRRPTGPVTDEVVARLFALESGVGDGPAGGGVDGRDTFRRIAEATARHEPTLYAGDITVLRDGPVDGDDPYGFWEDIALGDVQVTDLAAVAGEVA